MSGGLNNRGEGRCGGAKVKERVPFGPQVTGAAGIPLQALALTANKPLRYSSAPGLTL